MSEDALPYYTAGFLMVDIPIVDRGTTLYTRTGDWLPWFCIFTSVAAVLFVLGRCIWRHLRSIQNGGH